MRDWIAKLTPPPWLAKKLVMAAVLIGACVTAFCWGRKQNTTLAQGNPSSDPFGMNAPKDRRVVAYLWQNVPVTREELGEYLIARFGAERLEFLVNRKVVEVECQKNGIFVTDAEVEQRFRNDLAAFGGPRSPLTEKEFVQNVLRRFNKTLYEWKEDVIRPKIMMEKLVGKQVTVSGDDVKKGFEARFGPKVKCRMIVVQEGNTALAEKIWQDARKSREEFLKVAKSQFIPNLAQEEGKVPPIHKHFGDKQIEDMAFRMKVGEVCEPLKMPDGTFVILLCEEHVAADLSAKYEHVWMQIHKEVQDLKVARQIPEVFNELRTKANVRMVLDNAVHHLARNEHMRGGLSAFDQMPQGPNPAPTNVPAPQPTKVIVPEGTVVPSIPNAAPAPPLNVIPSLPKFQFDSPTEKK